LSQQIEFVGKSGARYRYTTLDEDRFLPPAGANFVLAHKIGQARTIVLAGETDNLAGRVWRDSLAEAKGRYGDVEVLTRLNVKSAVRREELADMIDGYEPPMNLGDKGASGSAPEGADEERPAP
jgi:hypothetical protein